MLICTSCKLNCSGISAWHGAFVLPVPNLLIYLPGIGACTDWLALDLCYAARLEQTSIDIVWFSFTPFPFEVICIPRIVCNLGGCEHAEWEGDEGTWRCLSGDLNDDQEEALHNAVGAQGNAQYEPQHSITCCGQRSDQQLKE